MTAPIWLPPLELIAKRDEERQPAIQVLINLGVIAIYYSILIPSTCAAWVVLQRFHPLLTFPASFVAVSLWLVTIGEPRPFSGSKSVIVGWSLVLISNVIAIGFASAALVDEYPFR